MSVWVYPTSNGDSLIFEHDGCFRVSRGSPPTATSGNGEFGFGIFNGSNWRNALSEPISLNEWYIVTAVWDGSIASLYINGDLADTVSVSTVAEDSNQTSIGSNRGKGDFYDGDIADVRVYSDVLSPQEIITLYQKGGGSSN